MNIHDNTVVDLRAALGEIDSDIGCVAEALVYYENVTLISDSPHQWSKLCNWFLGSDQLGWLLQLLTVGNLRVVHLPFVTCAAARGNVVQGLGNIEIVAQDGRPKTGMTVDRMLTNALLRASLRTPKNCEQFSRHFRTHAVECTSEFVEPALRTAEADFIDPIHCRHLVNRWVSNECTRLCLPVPPSIEVAIADSRNSPGHLVLYKPDDVTASFLQTHNIAIPEPASLLAELGKVNQNLYIAAKYRADFWPPLYQAALYSDRLLREAARVSKRCEIVTSLECKVSLPDIQSLVNSHQINALTVRVAREHAAEFRLWLRTSEGTNKDAALHYSAEIGKLTPLQQIGNRFLRFAGLAIGGGAAMATQALVENPVTSAVAGAVVGAISQQVIESNTPYSKPWRPNIFGCWLTEKIDQSTRSHT